MSMESKKLQEAKLQSKAKKREKITVIRHDARGEAKVMKGEELRKATKAKPGSGAQCPAA